MNEFEKYLLTSAVGIKKEVKNILSEWSDIVENQTPSLKKINDLFLKSFDGGKYIRGTLVKLGLELSYPSNFSNPSVLKIAAAFEILHTSLLIHDDIIDKSLIRRGKPTLHSAFKNSHYGISQAICLGDIGFFIAAKIISETNLKENIKNKILSYFSQVTLDTILGQMLDIKSSYEKIKKEKDVLTIQRLKTAYYTISGPLSTGAMLGKENANQLKAIKKFGENLGIAYQIKDDMLGIFGDEKIIGKPIMSDVAENKNTLLIVYALKKATKKQKQFLQKYYGNKNINKKQLEEIKDIFIKTGSFDYSQEKVKKYSRKAEDTILSITKNRKHQNYLLQFSKFIIDRVK